MNGTRGPQSPQSVRRQLSRRMGLSGRWSTTDRAAEDRRRQQMVRRSTAKFLVASVPVASIAVLLHFAVGLQLQTCLVLGFAGVYAVYNECVRIAALQDGNKQMAAKVRHLLESRRAAGLKRLGQDVPGRKQSWPRPPYSYTATVLGRFNSERLEPLREREVDYRSLAIDAVEKLVDVVRGAEAGAAAAAALSSPQSSLGSPGVASPRAAAAPRGGPMRWRQLEEIEELEELRPEGSGGGGGGGGAPGASELRVWLLQRLMHDGPTPENDPELFQDLHAILDIAEAKVGERGFFCRLCLGYHLAGTRMRRVQLSCGKCLCGRCAQELVEGVLDGRVRVPVACPTGSCHAVLGPELVEGLVSAEDFERFQRMHTVKMSLDTSAPHNEGLAARLAQARGAAGGSGGSPTSLGGSAPLPTVSERPSFGDEWAAEPLTPRWDNDAKQRPSVLVSARSPSASASGAGGRGASLPSSPRSPADGSVGTSMSMLRTESPRKAPELSLPAAVAVKAAAAAAAAGAAAAGGGGRGCWPTSPLSPPSAGGSGGGASASPFLQHPSASPPTAKRSNGGVSIASLLGPLKLDGGSSAGGSGGKSKRHDD